MIKKMLTDYLTVRRYYLEMQIVSNVIFKKKDTIKVRLTKIQIDLLMDCAKLGIFSRKDLLNNINQR